MQCPNRRCKRSVPRMVCWTDKQGKVYWGCHACILSFHPDAKNVPVRTGRKIWHSYEVYGKEKTIEKNKDWIKGVEHRAARQRNETGCISEGAFKFLEEHTKRGMIKPRVDGRPAR